MKLQTQHISLREEFLFLSNSETALPISLKHLFITKLDNQIVDLHLTIFANPRAYERINSAALFNLDKSLRVFTINDDLSDLDGVQIEINLQLDLLITLNKHNDNIEKLVHYLLNLYREEPENPLLCCESWFGLSVIQEAGSIEVGYRTLWYYINLTNLIFSIPSKKELHEALFNFLQSWTRSNLRLNIQVSLCKILMNLTENLIEIVQSLITTT